VELKERVAQILTEEVAPALGMDDIRVEVLDVTDGVARLRLDSGCLACPGTVMTIVHGLEQELRKRLPEVQCVEVT
jgi:Fe-S cluster biogenesis protein NfuA